MISAQRERSKAREANARGPNETGATWRERIAHSLQTRIDFIPSREFPTWLRKKKTPPDAAGSLPMASSPSTLGSTQRLPLHFHHLCAAPLLDAAAERAMFRRMNFLKYRADSIRNTFRGDKRDARAWEQFEASLDEACEIRNRLVHANVRLVVALAKKYADPWAGVDELLSEGLGCLIKAVEKFDFSRGFRFSTYATRSVSRELWRAVRRNQRDRKRAMTGLDERLHLEPGTEIPIPEYDSDYPDGWTVGGVERFMKVLDERERFIVDARFGFRSLGTKPTFEAIGKLLGVSKERVRQLERRAMDKLRYVAGKGCVA